MKFVLSGFLTWNYFMYTPITNITNTKVRRLYNDIFWRTFVIKYSSKIHLEVEKRGRKEEFAYCTESRIISTYKRNYQKTWTSVGKIRRSSGKSIVLATLVTWLDLVYREIILASMQWCHSYAILVAYLSWSLIRKWNEWIYVNKII